MVPENKLWNTPNGEKALNWQHAGRIPCQHRVQFQEWFLGRTVCGLYSEACRIGAGPQVTESWEGIWKILQIKWFGRYFLFVLLECGLQVGSFWVACVEAVGSVDTKGWSMGMGADVEELQRSDREIRLSQHHEPRDWRVQLQVRGDQVHGSNSNRQIQTKESPV